MKACTPKGEPLKFLLNLIADPINGCVLWPYSKNPKGYGTVWFDGHMRLAHRVALILLTAEDPEHLQAAHGCRNKLCVNPLPAHGLRWATPIENQRDKKADGVDNSGERHGRAKLTQSDVLYILLDQRNASDIAQDFGVSTINIHKIKAKQGWSYLYEEYDYRSIVITTVSEVMGPGNAGMEGLIPISLHASSVCAPPHE